MIEIGDIVEVNAELWAVMELSRATPRGTLQAMLARYAEGNGGRPTQRWVSADGLDPVVSPTWEPGQRVRFGGRMGIVLRAEGDAIIVADERPRRYDGGHEFTRSFATPVPRGTLARDNIASLTSHLQ